VRLQSDIAAIDAYLAANNITNVQTEPNGVRYVITQQGNGNTPCLENFIVATYTGKLLRTGTVFADNATSTFKINGLILGWQLVLPAIKAGSKVTLYIPSGYGYGPEGGADGKIPSNANLIFDIELVSIR
jgi:FKBP-type peptidyl-prolyl cis-trans isomerase